MSLQHPFHNYKLYDYVAPFFEEIEFEWAIDGDHNHVTPFFAEARINNTVRLDARWLYKLACKMVVRLHWFYLSSLSQYKKQIRQTKYRLHQCRRAAKQALIAQTDIICLEANDLFKQHWNYLPNDLKRLIVAFHLDVPFDWIRSRHVS